MKQSTMICVPGSGPLKGRAISGVQASGSGSNRFDIIDRSNSYRFERSLHVQGTERSDKSARTTKKLLIFFCGVSFVQA